MGMSTDSGIAFPFGVWMGMFPEATTSNSAASTQGITLRRQLDAFLQSVERRALTMLELGTRQREDALDLLQDCMLRFVRGYGDRPPAEWAPLFFRVISNSLVDWQRRQAVRRKVLAIWPWGRSEAGQDEGAAFDPPAADAAQPDAVMARDALGRRMNEALANLPTRQRQVFLLREWQGLSVADTALALGVSEGSIKTHLSRANVKLREALHEHA